MSPRRSALICPICSVGFASLSRHLRRIHACQNDVERHTLVSLSSGRVNIRLAACPVHGCGYQSTRLDRHLADGHPELGSADVSVHVRSLRWATTLNILRDLRASDPEVPMVSKLDLGSVNEGEQPPGDESVADVCRVPECVQIRQDQAALKHSLDSYKANARLAIKRTRALTRELRNVRRSVRGDTRGHYAEASTSRERSPAWASRVPSPEPEAPSDVDSDRDPIAQTDVFKGTGRRAVMTRLTLPQSIGKLNFHKLIGYVVQ